MRTLVMYADGSDLNIAVPGAKFKETFYVVN